MACRFPGGEDLEAFHDMLMAGRDAIREVPADRWPGAPEMPRRFGRDADPACRWGAFVERLDEFDAGFFRIAPVEARLLDPQQRILLETSWCALEDAGIDPVGLHGSKSGVYAGVCTNDYLDLILDTPESSSLYSATGTSASTALGRIAFTLGFEGPAITVDTACSSSLVAVHQAATALQRGEADLILAGGVNVILSPNQAAAFASGGMLAPDGRCKTFDASADGFVRGEGCGMVVLKRLSDAEAAGDRIRAVIRGSAVNQDGASSGLTAPNGPSQESVIAAALEQAGMNPAQIDYLEAHGTGTELGDPIEVEAASAVYGRGRSVDRPLLIGSVKTNIGHLEAAAGIAGLIKTVLAMGERRIPSHLNFSVPNPHVDWASLPVRVTSAEEPWPDTGDRTPCAAVSSFGFSGTNAHVILEGPGGDLHAEAASAGPEVDIPLPEGTTPVEKGRTGRLLPLSGQSMEAVAELAGRYSTWLRQGGPEFHPDRLSDMAWTASVGRSRFDARAGVTFDDEESLAEGLAELSRGRRQAVVGTGTRSAFLFTGQGSQWVGMGRELYETEPVVRGLLDRCDRTMLALRGKSLLDVMFGAPPEALDDTRWTQPALYALESALAAQWRFLGLQPTATLGHSIGELAAAFTAGILSLEDGLRFAARRGELMESVTEPGAMVAIFAPRDRVSTAISSAAGGELSIAADNGTHLVVSGPSATVRALADELGASGVKTEILRTSQAFHSALMDPVLGELEAFAAGLPSAPPELAFVSNLTGRELRGAPDGGYWRRQAREEVAFAAGISRLAELGVDVLIEVGPHAVLTRIAQAAWPGEPPSCVTTLMRPSVGTSESGFSVAASAAWEAGLPLRLEGLFAGERRRRVPLPTYPFQRQRHWIDGRSHRRRADDHPLLGTRTELAGGGVVFETGMSASDPEWLADHRLFGRLVVPGAFYGSLAASAAAPTDGSATVEAVQIHSPMILDDASASKTVQIVLGVLDGNGVRTLEIFSRDGGNAEWVLHAEGRIREGADLPAPAPPDFEAFEAFAEAPSEVYATIAEAGLDLGPSFHVIRTGRRSPGEAVSELSLSPGLALDAALIHPVLLDGVFQTVAAASGIGDELYLPFGWDDLRLRGPLPERLICHVRLREPGGAGKAHESGSELQTADIHLYDDSGRAVGEVSGYRTKRATRQQLFAALQDVDDLLYEIAWKPVAEPGGLLDASFLAALEAIGAAAGGIDRWLRQDGIEPAAAAELSASLETLSRSFALAALDELGWRPEAGTVAASLRTGLRVVESQEALLGRVLELATGTTGTAPEETRRDEAAMAPHDLAAFLIERFPFGAAEIGFLRHCGSALADILRGRADPRALLFGNDDRGVAALHRGSPTIRATNRLLASVIATAAASLPAGRTLRVLELGAGVSTAAGEILDVLPPERMELELADVTESGLAGRRNRSSQPLAAGKVLDIGRDPLEQGFDAHGHDIVVVADLPDAVGDVDMFLDHCRRLLAPSGYLILLVDLTSQGSRDLTFGLLGGGLQPASEAVWRDALAGTGFGDTAFLSASPEATGQARRAVIIARGPTAPGIPSGTWVIGAARERLAEGLAKALVSRSQTVIVASPDARPTAAYSPDVIRVRVVPERREAWRALFETLQTTAPLAGVVHLGYSPDDSGDARDSATAAVDATGIALALVQGLEDSGAAPKVWFATRGGQVVDSEPAIRIEGAALWGFARTVGLEAPQLGIRLIDLDPEETTATGNLLQELLGPDRETAVAWRRGTRWGTRLIRHFDPDSEEGGIDFSGSWLITGGLGELGMETAGWLAENGAGTIVLNGRREPDRKQRTALADLAGQGVEVQVEIADIANAAAVDAMLQRIAEAGPPLAGIIHAAGTLRDGALANLNRERLEQAMDAKVRGAWNLHRSTAGMGLRAFILFSSVAGVLGSGGQANYAAANAFLDQLARHRRSQGLVGQSIAWGAWSSAGMAEQRRQRMAAEMEANGVGWISPRQGRQALGRILERSIPSALAIPIEWRRFALGRETEPMLEEVVVARADTKVVSAPSPDILARLQDTPTGQREGLLVAFIQGELQAVMHLPDLPPADTGFFDLGMDSLMAVELRGRLNRALEGVVTLPGSVAFDYPNATSLARHLAGEIGVLSMLPARPAVRPAPRPEVDMEDGVAVVGMACRFPGGEDLDAFRDLLMTGRSGVREIPSERWPVDAGMLAEAESMANPACRWGAFLDGIDLFDAPFFRVGPIEAKLLDPQQRMLLETSWLALEDAGIDPSGIRGSRTGVYAGMSGFDYRELIAETVDVPHLYSITGVTHSTAIGRIAFALGLEGPAMSIDTACSSSLVALHLATTALRRGEADMALAGGVNALLAIGATASFADAGMLAPDGRCKTFDAAADGYVRGEGCGMVALKRLADAKADGDRIWAVIRGTAVNQDGASAGLTVPNGPAQERVIAAALDQAGINPADVDYLEAHGTGTELGDPIEIGAASAVYGRGRVADRPLMIGSVKTNIGHLEAAAGVAGLIKTILAMASGTIPRHLNFSTPNPHVDWTDLPVRVAADAQAWPDTGKRPRLAAISSFGLSGTNAHVVLEDGRTGAEQDDTCAGDIVGSEVVVPIPDQMPLAGEARRERLLPLSGRTTAALGRQASRYAAWLQEADGKGLNERLADLAWTASTGRNRFECRAGIVFADAAELATGLAALAKDPGQGSTGTRARVGFLFTGQGSQWAGMGRVLYETEPVVRGVLDRCEAVMRDMRGESLLDVMFGSTAQGLDDTRWTQPALYALACALATQWQSLGVSPDAVIGHSVGELAAAHVAGVFPLEDGLRFAARRGELMAATPGSGAMAAVFAPRSQVVETIRAAGDELSIAADNGTHLVVSGPATGVADLCGKLAAAGRKTEPLRTSHAFHSALMEPALDELERIAGEISATAPVVPLVSNVSGRELATAPDSGYWCRHAREEVAFASGVSRLAALGIDCLIEIGPHPVLGPLARASWPGESSNPLPVVASMERPPAREAAKGFALAAAAAWEAGIAVDLAGLFTGERRRRVSAPTYPFERQRHWIEGPRRRRGATGHPLLGTRTELAGGGVLHETQLSARELPWLADRCSFDRTMATGLAHLALAAVAGETITLDEFRINAQLALSSEGRPKTVQVTLGPSGDGSREVTVHSREGGSEWVLHAQGRVRVDAQTEYGSAIRTEAIAASLSPAPIAELPFEEETAIETLWRGTGEALAELTLPSEPAPMGTAIHPTMLDGIFQTLAALGDSADVRYRILGWERIWLQIPMPERLFCHARLRQSVDGPSADAPEALTADIRLWDGDGNPIGNIAECRVDRVTGPELELVPDDVASLLYETVWRPCAAPNGVEAARIPPQDGVTTDDVPGTWVIAAEQAAGAADLAAALIERCHEVIVVSADAPSTRQSARDGLRFLQIDLERREEWHSLFEDLHGDSRLQGVLYLASFATGDPTVTALRLSVTALALVQGMEDSEAMPKSGLWFATCGGQGPDGRVPEVGLAGSVLWGFARTVAIEAPHLQPRLVDLDPEDAQATVRLMDELLRADGETEIAWRRGERYAARLARLEAVAEADPVRVDGTWLITGGTGSLGLEVAGWLAERGARTIILNARREPDSGKRRAVAALEDYGVEVKVELADIADPQQVEAMLGRIGKSEPPLVGIVHAAGTLSDGALHNLGRDRFAEVMAAKLQGAWNLHRSTAGMDLSAFVLYASAAGVLGSGGQANYAAANAFLDQLARHRRSQGLSGQSIAWGAWSSGGMAAQRQARLAAEMQAAGIGWISPHQGRQALDQILDRDTASVMVLPIDWTRFTRSQRPGRLLSEFIPATSAATTRPASVPDFLAHLRQTPEAEREGVLVTFLQEQLQAALHLSETPSADAGFFDLGMDSLTALDFRGRLNRAFAGVVSVPSTVAFDHPDIARLARHLAEEIGVLPPLTDRTGPATRPTPSAEDEVAIVGMACRFPGGEGLEAFRDLLTAGRHGIREVPSERWPGAPAMPDGLVSGDEPACRWGAFIDGVDLFDAGFFRIAPVEAKLLDPQQRMLLETSWQALEDAGIDPTGLRGSRTGVYAGMSAYDYRELVSGTRDAVKIYSATGTSASTAIGRVAFALGLEGPAMAIDTACSSSLVAVHQAAAALRRGEAELALAGGVNLILSPTMMAVLTDAGALAPDGRCKTFDAAADGYVRGEGCGMLVLKRLADAERDGNRIWAVIRGSAVNQDGASAGLTVPNGTAQERVISEALVRAGLEPVEVDYLEAHGTGTELGDPIELGAASAVYGRGRDSDRPLLIGSVKTNIGHLEAAAGVAGIIKVAMAMAEGTIPRHLNFQVPNPHVDWSNLPLRVVDKTAAWPANGIRPPRAAVSSFGFSGTNAHIILEGRNLVESGADGVTGRQVEIPVPDGAAVPGSERRQRLLVLSGRSAGAVGALADRYLARYRDAGSDADGMADMAWTSAVGRSRFEFRAGLAFDRESDLVAGLESLSRGERIPASGAVSKAAFLFTGQGSQWNGMGRELHASEPVARGVLERCDAALREFRGESLLEIMFETSGTALDDTRWTQPALYALECALAAQWRFLGLEPAAVLGHSVGELAAAHVAGVFSLTDGLRLAAFRGERMADLPGEGAMAAVFAPRDRVTAVIRETGGELSIAADNGTHLVVSGSRPVLATFLETCGAAGLRTELLRTSHAFHSAFMEPMLDELERFARTIPMSPPRIPLIGNVTGRDVEDAPDGEYWRRHAREEVAYAAGVTRLAALAVDVLVELGPHPVLAPMAQAVWDQKGGPPPAVASLRRPSGDGSGTGFAAAVGAAWEAGLPLRLEGLFAGEKRRRVSLPTYPFERQRYWIEGRGSRHALSDHPLLGARTELASGDIVYETEMSPGDPSWLKDHRLFGKPVAQGALYGVLAATAADPPDGVVAVDALQIHAPLILEDEGVPRTVQVIMGQARDDGTRSVRVHTRQRGEVAWLLHAECRVSTGDAVPELEVVEFPEGDMETDSPREVYAAIAATGLRLGPSFQVIKAVRHGSGEALTDMSLPAEDDSSGTTVHPVLFDGAFQSFAVAAESEAKGSLYLPVRWEWLRLRQPLPERLICHVRLRDSGREDPSADVGPEFLTADINLYDEDGTRVGEVSGFSAKRSSRMQLFSAFEGIEGLLYEPVWWPSPAPAGILAADFLLSPLVVSADRSVTDLQMAVADAAPGQMSQSLERPAGNSAASADEASGRRLETDSGPGQRAAGQLLAEAVRVAARALPDGRTLRILEIGAGRSIAVSSVIEVLPEGRFDYLVTDQDEEALVAARDLFDSGAVSSRVLDIHRDAAEQGVPPHGFDVVVVTDMTTLSPGLEQALVGCRRLLAPSGLLFLLGGPEWLGVREPVYEPLEEDAWTGGEDWRHVLKTAGFGEVATLPVGQEPTEGSLNTLLLARGPDAVAEVPGTWVIAAEQTSAAEGLAALLVSRNQTAIIASGDAVPGSSDQPGVLLAQVALDQREAWRSLFDEVGARAQIRGVVHLGNPGDRDPSQTDIPTDATRLSSGALALVQGLEDAGTAISAGIWFATCGGQVVAGEALVGFAESTLWGLARTVALEAPQLGVRLVDLDPEEPASMDRLVDELLSPDRETAVAWRGGERRSMRLVRHVDAGAEVEEFDFGGTWLITGGLGSLGLAVAEWLADRGVGTIVLNGRRKPDETRQAAIAALKAHGVDVRVELADVADAAAVDSLLERLAGSLPPLAGIVHAAGTLADAALLNQSREHIEQVMAAKVWGAWNLHRATLEMPLTAFVLFSSLAGVLGSGGQLNYAAANAFLDQLARHRRSLGLAGQSIAWGAWSSGGMAAEREDRMAAEMEAAGISWITPRQGLLALDQIMRRQIGSAVVSLTDWSRFAARHQTAPVILDALLPSVSSQTGQPGGAASDLILRLEQVPEEDRRDVIVRFLQDELQAVLHLQEPPPPDVGFFDLGMDSLMAVELRSRINLALAGAYVAPGSVVFEHPDVRSLAGHIARELGVSQSVASAPSVQLRRPTSDHDERVAIVGMACRFPGAPDLWSFWDILEAGGNTVSRIPGERWHHDELEFAEENTAVAASWGAFVEDIDRFDAAFFRIPPIEARLIDPQQRMMLETSWQALEDAGLDPGSMKGRRAALYGGISTTDYREVLLRSGEDFAFFSLALGNDGSSTVGRIAYLLGLEGAAVPVNTVCSSALVAVHHAAAALRRQEADLALAGGVNAILTPTITKGYAEVGMLSPSGQNRVFDAGADGYVRSEGCGMLVLKRLADAEADGDRIWAVIRGSSVTQNGSGAGFTAPSAAAQSLAIRQALAVADMEPADVDYLEAHGSATDLGDQVELNAAAAVYGVNRAADRPLLVGSVKTNIGHAEAAAGATSLIKVVLSMNRGVIPAHLNLETPNPNLDWSNLPIRVTTEAMQWPHFQDRRVRAGVSSFSLTGANAHVIVESHRLGNDAGENTLGGRAPVAAPATEDGTPVTATPWTSRILPISAKSAEALRELAGRYMSRIRRPGTADILADLAWSAGVGRGHHDYRAGAVFTDLTSLAEALGDIADGERDVDRGACTRPALVFAGSEGWSGNLDPALPEAEPIVREMLDRCDTVSVNELGRSVSDLICGLSGDGVDSGQPSLALPARYVLDCIQSALWRNVGVRPAAVYGQGDGRVAAGYAAGAVSLEDGFRIAVARGRILETRADDLDASDAPSALSRLLDSLRITAPTRTLISDISGGAYSSGTSLENGFWEPRPGDRERVAASLHALARTGVDIVIAIGSSALPWTAEGEGWPATAEYRVPPVIGPVNRITGAGEFPIAVAEAYEAGLDIDFAGLFTGEIRHRVSLPPYPFERHRHWVDRTGREPVKDGAWYAPR